MTHYLTLPQVAEKMGLSYSQVYREFKSTKGISGVPAVTINGRNRFKEEEIERIGTLNTKVDGADSSAA